MKFQMWSIFHVFYIFAPILVASALFFAFRKRTEKTKWIGALTLAIINMVILVVRNIDIFARYGMDAELIPLAPCHFANIVFLIAVLTKKQNWYNLAWCLNLPFGFLAIVFASPLANQSTLFAIRPMTYLFGHLFIVVSILYVFLVGLTKFNKKTFLQAMVIAGIWVAACLGANIVYNMIGKGTYGLGSANPYGFANYMYMLSPEKGTPLTIIHGIIAPLKIANFTIDFLYIFILCIVGLVVFFLFYLLHQLFRRKFS